MPGHVLGIPICTEIHEKESELRLCDMNVDKLNDREFRAENGS